MSKERPILFSDQMVRAILDGRKTQTRRVIKGRGLWSIEDADDYSNRKWPGFEDEYGTWCDMPCPYGAVGDRLWVRETWLCVTGEPGPITCSYRADHGKTEFAGLWKPSIHMPRWASRITLEITGVRVERLNEISHHDAMQEGLIEWTDPPRVSSLHYGLSCADVWETNAPAAFKRLWESINGAGSWALNPWVWVVEFKRVDAA